MAKRSPELNDQQIKTGEFLNRIRMAWVALPMMFVLFTTGFIAFLWAIFHSDKEIATTILGGIDGVLVWGVQHMLRYLFPVPSSKNKTS